MTTMNGNGGTTAPTKTVGSRSLQKRNISKSQKAYLLAQVFARETSYQPTIVELARAHGLCSRYISEALKESPVERAAKAAGRVPCNLSQKLAAPETIFRLPPRLPTQPEEATNSNGSSTVEPVQPATASHLLTTRW